MGKAAKRFRNKFYGKPRKRKPGEVFVKSQRLEEQCFWHDDNTYCPRKAVSKHFCTTCEDMGRERDEVYSVAFCEYHTDQATAKIRKHAIAGHPLVNIPRAILAGLKGKLDD